MRTKNLGNNNFHIFKHANVKQKRIVPLRAAGVSIEVFFNCQTSKLKILIHWGRSFQEELPWV